MVRLAHSSGHIITRLFTSVLTCLLLGSGATGAVAADRLVLRWGPLSQTIRLEDLERATTGHPTPDPHRSSLWLWPQIKSSLILSLIHI